MFDPLLVECYLTQDVKVECPYKQKSVDQVAVKEENIMLVVELSDAYTHQHAMMIEFMHALIAFVTVPHTDPLIQLTDIAKPLFLEPSLHFDMAVALVASRTAQDDHEVQARSRQHQQIARRMMVDEEDDEYGVNGDRVFPQSHLLCYKSPYQFNLNTVGFRIEHSLSTSSCLGYNQAHWIFQSNRFLKLKPSNTSRSYSFLGVLVILAELLLTAVKAHSTRKAATNRQPKKNSGICLQSGSFFCSWFSGLPSLLYLRLKQALVALRVRSSGVSGLEYSWDQFSVESALLFSKQSPAFPSSLGLLISASQRSHRNLQALVISIKASLLFCISVGVRLGRLASLTSGCSCLASQIYLDLIYFLEVGGVRFRSFRFDQIFERLKRSRVRPILNINKQYKQMEVTDLGGLTYRIKVWQAFRIFQRCRGLFSCAIINCFGIRASALSPTGLL